MILKQILTNIINFLEKIKSKTEDSQAENKDESSRKLSKKDSSKKENKQCVLTPILIEPDQPAYKAVEYLGERIKKKDAKNIAVTGPYGSGKSSILLTFKKVYNKNKYLNLSLATLKAYQDEKNSSSDNNRDDEEINRLIEYSILQQLIYREKRKVIPNSRIKRIFHIKKKIQVLITSAIIISVISFIVILDPNIAYSKWLRSYLNLNNDIVKIIASVYMIGVLFYIILYLIRFLGNSSINVLNLKNVEVKLSGVSIFNEYLDEILYFFQATKYNVVIIEDLDRFDSVEIFLKLRELNFIINESNMVNRKDGSPIVFVYAIKDDMFKDTDRVKFFDYIVTVIPTINFSNSKDKLKEELSHKGYNDIDDKDLKEMGLFLNDMRLLKNIVNEYQQYRDIILDKKLPLKNLLAIIIFKNYYPRLFVELHLREGKVYDCFDSKSKFIDFISEKLQGKIKQANQDKDDIIKNQHLKENELRLLYINEYERRIENKIISFEIEDKGYTHKEIAENASLFDKLTGNNNVTYRYYNEHHSKQVKIPFSAIEKAVDEILTYKQRLKAIQTNYAQLLLDISEMEAELSELKKMKLSEIMQREEFKQCPEYQKLELEPMIELFLLRGYIDENYYDYISYFYPNTISKKDKDFVMQIKLNNNNGYDTKPDSVEACISELQEYDYNSKSILNYDILNYLIKSKDKEKILDMVNVLIKYKAWDFLVGYYIYFEEGMDIIFSNLFARDVKYWQEFISYDEKCRSTLIEIWLKYAELDKSIEDSKSWIISNYATYVSHIEQLGVKHLQQLVKKYQYQFKELNTESKELLNTIIETNSYELNSHNILLIANALLKREPAITSVNLSLIYETENEFFIGNVNSNLTTFLAKIFLGDTAKNETPKSIVKIINDNTIYKVIKEAYLKGQNNTISLKDIKEKTDKEFAIKELLITPNWDEVNKYYSLKNNRITDELIGFIEKSVDKLIESPFSSDTIEAVLFDSLIVAEKLSINVYRKMVSALPKREIEETDLSALSDEKIKFLLARSMIKYNDFNTRQFSSFGDDIFVQYLLSLKNDFLNNLSDIEYSKELLLILLNSEELTAKEKGLLIPYIEENHLEDNKDLAESAVDVLQQEVTEVDFDVLCEILRNSEKTEENLSVINQTILNKSDIDEYEIDSLLNTLPSPFNIIASRGKRPRLASTPNLLKLVNTLKTKSYISSFEVDNKSYIRINTKKQ